MANLELGEIIVDAFIAKLRAGMPQRVTAMNQRRQDQTILFPPAPESYFGGRMKTLPTTPAVFVMEGRGQFKPVGAHSMVYETEILVYVAESDQDGPHLAKRLQRQAACVVETLWDDPPAERLAVEGPGSNVFHVRPLRTIPGTVFEPEGPDAWRGFYVIVFRASQEEV